MHLNWCFFCIYITRGIKQQWIWNIYHILSIFRSGRALQRLRMISMFHNQHWANQWNPLNRNWMLRWLTAQARALIWQKRGRFFFLRERSYFSISMRARMRSLRKYARADAVWESVCLQWHRPFISAICCIVLWRSIRILIWRCQRSEPILYRLR